MGFLDDEEGAFFENRIFSYNKSRKVAFGVFLILAACVLITFIAIYAGFWRHSDFFLVKMFNKAVLSVTSSIGDSTALGVFYAGVIGGLFFIFMPLEVLFARSLGSNPFLTVLLIYLIGITIAYTANYFIGLKLSKLSKKIISPRKFYKVKGVVNRYGGIGIFLFNATPLPSQLLAAILGVFRYNKTRFYVYFLLGQITKCTVIAFGIRQFF